MITEQEYKAHKSLSKHFFIDRKYFKEVYGLPFLPATYQQYIILRNLFNSIIMIKTEIKHELTPAGGETEKMRVEKTVKTVKLFGITIYRKVYHYPELEYYDVVGI
ncbi:hypothetical protein [Pedobacter arcticus]|uniref:hypothetical protein n=1 Tax=Pedobacter arcticus TaxID=752140 RepID=UPI0002D622BF|nr:hypothetical protein [Pedobacter arcticus]